MIECPNCGGLNPTNSQICGSCGSKLENNNINNEPQTSIGLDLYQREDFNTPVKPKDIENRHAAISFKHIVLFLFSVLSWAFVPYRWLKLLLAFLFFYLAENSNNKNSIVLVLTRIVTGIEIWGVVIALILKLSTSAEVVAKYFEYFRF